MDGVNLTFEMSALKALAKKAIDKGTGARGLRSILESVMADIMYDLPARDDVEECSITDKVINEGAEPKLKLSSESAVDDSKAAPRKRKSAS